MRVVDCSWRQWEKYRACIVKSLPVNLRNIWAGALVFCATALAYIPSLSGDFIWNDSDYVTAPALRSIDGLRRIWTDVGATQQYYPLLHTAFWVQHRLWGDHPLGYHIFTLLLHIGAAILFALVLKRLSVPGAWLAGLLFAVHPVHVESVAWITEQKNTLSLVFYLAAALVYLDFDDARRPRAYVLGLALFLCALLCKTMTASLPAALLVTIWWKRGRIKWGRDVLPLVPWLALGAAGGLFSAWVERYYGGARGAGFDISAVERFLVSGRAIWFYAENAVLPFGLNFVYPRWTVDATVWWQWLFPLGAGALGVALWMLRGRTRAPLAAFLLFVGSLFPALGFVNLYGARYSWVWDHWQYLPDLGLLALIAAGMAACEQAFAGRLRGLRAAWAAVLVLFCALTWAHCGMFHDNETLFRETIARNPGCWMAYNNLGCEVDKAPSRRDEAIALYEKAVSINPDFAEGHNDLGLALSKIPGRMDEAIGQYEWALRLEPSMAPAHANLGQALSGIPGRMADAIGQYREAVRLKPDYAQAHFYLANALAQSGMVEDAVGHYEEALRIQPGLAEAENNLGMILCRTGRVPEGLGHIEAAIRINPSFAPAHFIRGLALLQTGRKAEAVAEFERVLSLRPGDPSAKRMLEMIRSSP